MKQKVLKTIVAGAMLSLVIGTGAFASSNAIVTVQNGDFVCDVEAYSNSYEGTLGRFTTNGRIDTSSLVVVNRGNAPKNFRIQASAYNRNTRVIEDSDYSYELLNPGSSDSIIVERFYNNERYRYSHWGTSFYYTNTDSVVIDNYECILYQYDRE